MSKPRFRVSAMRLCICASISALLVAAPSPARANEFLDDTFVWASAGQVKTDWVNVNPFKSTHPQLWYADTAHHACFLTGIGGDFNGAGERAYIYEDRGSWAVGVSSGSGNGALATASCLTIPDTSYQWPSDPTQQGAIWTEEQGIGTSIYLGYPKSGYQWFCFLTQVRGKFQGWGELVRTYPAGPDRWTLDGDSHQQGVMAEARCVQARTSTQRFELTQDWIEQADMEYAGGTNYGAYPNDLRQTYPTNANNCFLQAMSGKFEGTGEQLRILADGQDHNVNWDNHWWFFLFSQQDSVSGAAQCVW